MTHPRPLPSTLGTSFSTAEALESGASRRRLRSKDLSRPFHGARTRREKPRESGKEPVDTDPGAIDRKKRMTVMTLIHAYQTVMPAGTFFIGRTAAVILGAPIDRSDALEVALFSPAHGPRGKGVRGRRIAPHLVRLITVDDVAVTDPATTWVMLAAELSVRELVKVGDYFVRIPRGSGGVPRPDLQWATIDDLRAVIPGRRHAAKLRAALDQIRVGSASPLETDYRLDAAAHGLPEPECDVEIRDAQGRLLGISEFAYREYRIVVELEGDHHRTSKEQWDRDIQKYRDYERAGWKIIRLTSRDVRSSARGATIVAEELRLRGWEGGSGA